MFLFVLCVSWLVMMWSLCSGPVVVLKRGMLCDVEFFSIARLPTSLMIAVVVAVVVVFCPYYLLIFSLYLNHLG